MRQQKLGVNSLVKVGLDAYLFFERLIEIDRWKMNECITSLYRYKRHFSHQKEWFVWLRFRLNC